MKKQTKIEELKAMPKAIVDAETTTKYAVWDQTEKCWCVMKFGDIPVFSSRFKCDEVKAMCNEAQKKDKKLKRDSRRYITKPLELVEIKP